MRFETFEESKDGLTYKYTVNISPETEKDRQKLEEFKRFVQKQQAKQAEFDALILGKFPILKSESEIKPSVKLRCGFTTDVAREIRIASNEKKPCYGRTKVSLEDCKTCSSFATCYRQDLENLILTEGKGRGIQKIVNG